MFSNRRPDTSSLRRVAIAGAVVLLGVLSAGMPIHAQNPPPQLPACAAPPSPETDTWPVAGTDSLGVTASQPVSFSRNTLLANDRASTAITLVRVGPLSSHGGVISGTGPYTYTPAAAFVGADAFTYQISDATGETAIGVVTVSVSADLVAPTVSITSPTGGSVSGDVLIDASAADNVGVAGVRFFDGFTQIGAEVTGMSFRTTWNTRLVANGPHSLTAVARDAAGNTATSSAVSVTVANATVPNVVGLTGAAAQAAITGATLTVGTVTSATSTTVAAGLVISQSPASGVTAAPNSAVSYVLSLGAPLVTIPNVVGLTGAAAQAAITGASLTVGTVTSANSTTVAAGLVISQSPAGGGTAAPNSAVSYVLSLGAPAGTVPTVQATVFSDGTGPRTTPAFSTTAPGEVLIALAASDGPTTGVNNQNLTISGAGLTWTRVRRAAVQRGVAEIWTATAPTVLTNVTVTSTQSVTSVLGLPVNQSLTVLAFTGASGVGASNLASGATGAPRVSLVTVSAGSVVVGVGDDFDRAVARTVPAGQTKIHEFLAPSGDTMWMQRLNGTTGAVGVTVTLNDTAPTTDQWNFAIVEIKR
jgi:beta-lactam-binding protein with PASTA domain